MENEGLYYDIEYPDGTEERGVRLAGGMKKRGDTVVTSKGEWKVTGVFQPREPKGEAWQLTVVPAGR